jgi:hypothetical protein
MCRRVRAALLGLLLFVAPVSGQTPAPMNPLIGAWQVTEIDNPNQPPITNLRASLYVFSERHYNFARVSRPLPPYPSNDKATEADKAAVFDALYLNAGSYTVSGGTLTTKVTVAKSAFVMEGPGAQYEFTVTGKTLLLTQRPSGATLKLVRLD